MKDIFWVDYSKVIGIFLVVILMLVLCACEIGIYLINGPTQMNGPSYG